MDLSQAMCAKAGWSKGHRSALGYSHTLSSLPTRRCRAAAATAAPPAAAVAAVILGTDTAAETASGASTELLREWRTPLSSSSPAPPPPLPNLTPPLRPVRSLSPPAVAAVVVVMAATVSTAAWRLSRYVPRSRRRTFPPSLLPPLLLLRRALELAASLCVSGASWSSIPPSRVFKRCCRPDLRDERDADGVGEKNHRDATTNV